MRSPYHKVSKNSPGGMVRLNNPEGVLRKLEPVLSTLERCLEETKGLRGVEAEEFRTRLGELQRFAVLGDRVMERVGRQKSGRILSWIARFMK